LKQDPTKLGLDMIPIGCKEVPKPNSEAGPEPPMLLRFSKQFSWL
jgi:hypothetical protein